MDEIELPDYLKFLDDGPCLQFLCEDSVSNEISPLLKRKRMSLTTLLNVHRKRGRRVICSIKKRRSLSKYSFEQTPRAYSSRTMYLQKPRTSNAPRLGFRVPSTCVPQKQKLVPATIYKSSQFTDIEKKRKYNSNVELDKASRTWNSAKNIKQKRLVKAPPACKKSIYGKLPTGSRAQDTEEFAEPLNDLSLSNDRSFSEAPSWNCIPPCIEINTEVKTKPNAEEKTEPSTEEKTEPLKKPRKSILDIVERYNKLKASKKTTPNK